MARAGELTGLVKIRGGETLLPACAARFEAADDELFAAFGFRMRVLTPYGGYRSRADQRKINPALSPDYSEHCWGRAVDIDNQRSFRNVNEARFVAILAKHGITFTVSHEPWHATIATSMPLRTPKATLITKEQDMIRVRSKSSRIWYVIPEYAPPTTIPNGKAGSADHAHAKAYSDALGSPFKVLPSDKVRALLDDNAERRAALFREQATAFGVSTEKIEAGIAAIRAEIEALKAAEPVLSDEQVEAIAGQVRAELADALAESLTDDFDAVVDELRATLPKETVDALAARLTA